MTAPAVAKDHIDTDAPGYTGAAERDTNTNDIVQQQAFRRWYWLGVPGLAVAAYLSVLRIGFLSDDLLMLFTSKLKGFSIATILPSPTWTFLRPVGTVITWQAGWQLFGSNPFPYHLVGLVLHALASLALALWLAEATHRPIMGWLAGALFAVLPLHTEAVGWLAAQWDAWAAMFGLFALWLFTRWWSGRRTTDDGRPLMMGTRRPPVTFLLSLLCYALGIYSKESLLTFLPVFALSAWHVTPHMNKREWGRLLLALLPFGLVLASNVGLRFLLMGSLGGYTNVKIDTLSVFWSELAVAMRLMLSPINPLVMGNITEQVVAALASVAVLLGLVLYGRSVYRLLIVATAWLVLTLMPVLNLLGTPTDLQQNRFLYLASGAYCAVVAALFYSGYNALREGGRERAIMVGGAALCILLGIVTAWLQLRPWHTATAIASDIDAELQRLIPIEKRPKGVIWYTQDMPDNYQGAYIYRLGLGISRTFVNGDVPWIEPVIDATKPNLSTDSRDSYKIRFAYDAPSQRYHVSYLAGESTGTEPPTTEQAGDDLRVWDFRQCDPQMVGQWHSQEGRMQCRNDAGLQITTSNGDPQIIGPKVSLDLRASGARWLRVRVAARYPLAEKPEPAQNQLFWREPDDPWSGSASATFDIRQDGKTHIYWTFISPDQIETTLDYLRFDPVDGELPSDVRWVALDYVR